jgi:carbonic anhydrase/acetyltransferase-like protein (isoleucine patch superfamily)
VDEPLTPQRFADLLRETYLAADERLRNHFQRSLPFQDALFDRWERAKRLGFSEGASIYNSASIFGDVVVGAATWIGPNTLLDGTGGGISIGAYCSISSGVHIYTHDTVLWALSGGTLQHKRAPVRIGDCTYIGSQSVIAAGVSIGSRSVVAANSFVNADVPEATIVGGTPARKIGTVVGEGAQVRMLFDSKE